MAIGPKQAQDPLVLALDIGSSAGRVRVYDATGAPVRRTRQRIAHAIRTAPDGTAEIDPDAIYRNVVELIDGALAERALHGRVAAVAMDTFAASLVGVDEGGAAVTPCLTYADSRATAQVVALRREHDEAAAQQRTGCRFSASYLPAQIRWLRETGPERAGHAARWLSLGEFLYGRLTGQYAVSISIAAWTGMLDRHTVEWDAAMVAASGATVEQLSPIRDTTEPLDGAESFAARRWPALAGARWFPAVADGYASNVGSGATDGRTLALAAGTSGALRALVDGVPARVPPGLWCYRVDARRSLVGGALNDAGRLAAWLRATLQLPEDAALDAALLAPPDAATPAVLPFLTGERSPGWAAGATAAFLDVTAATGPPALWRGAMEGLALRYALIAEQLGEVVPEARRVVASGGVVETTPGWLQVVADALGRPVARSAERNATMLGTALIALDVLAPDVPRVPLTVGETYAPVADHAAYYAAAKARQEDLYARLVRDASPPDAARAAREGAAP